MPTLYSIYSKVSVIFLRAVICRTSAAKPSAALILCHEKKPTCSQLDLDLNKFLMFTSYSSFRVLPIGNFEFKEMPEFLFLKCCCRKVTYLLLFGLVNTSNN